MVLLTYKVVKGDTLSEVAKRYNTTVSELQRLNPSIKDVNKIHIGMTINVPNPANNSKGNYESIGKAFQKAMNDIEKLDSVKQLLKYDW